MSHPSSTVTALVSVVGCLVACPLLPGVDDLVKDASVQLVVTGLSAGDDVRVTAKRDELDVSSPADGRSLTFHLKLGTGSHDLALRVSRPHDGDDDRCAAVHVDVPANDSVTVSADASTFARCSGEGEGEGDEGEGDEGEGEGGEGEGEGDEGEGEGEGDCNDGDDCDDGIGCTQEDVCVGGRCVGSYSESGDCGACADVVCGSECSACCIDPDGTCEGTCGTCLADCTDKNCVCENATCARHAESGDHTALFCDGAVCVDDAHGVGDVTLSCESATCVLNVAESVGGVDARCDDQATCVIRAEDAAVALVCSDGSSCALSCETGGASCTIDCGTESDCSLHCGEEPGVDVPCAAGSTCACP